MYHQAEPNVDPQRLSTIVGDPAIAWDANSLSCNSVVCEMTRELLDELNDNRSLLGRSLPLEGADIDNGVFPVLRREVASLRERFLDRGPGFALLRGLNPDLHSALEMENVFWRICNALGAPLVQKSGSVRFGRVEDRGLPPEARPRYHETGIGGSIHTDSPIMPRVADIVGLLCVRPAAEGGDSKFVSVARVHDILLQHAEDLLSELYRPFFFDRRIAAAEVSSANPALLFVPIFSYDPGLGRHGLRLRWQPEYVWQAPQLQGVPPLREKQRLALHLLEGVLEDRSGAITLRLAMRPGDIQLVNNHRVAHGRTPFSDRPEDPQRPAARRLMRRVWIRRGL